MFKVAYKITLGSESYTQAKINPLISFDMQTAFPIPVNVCRFSLQPLEGLALNIGDAVTVELGYDDTLSKVFTGKIANVVVSIHNVRVEALGALHLATAARYNMLFEKQAAGDIVSAVLGKLSINTDTVESGITLAAYAMSEQTFAYDHLARLAHRCGFDLYANAEDKVCFQKYAASKTHTFEYGAHILKFERDTLSPAVDGLEIYGESPVGQGQGDDASQWFTKKDVKGTAGKTSGAIMRVIDPAIRTKDLAGTVATNLFKPYQVKAMGHVCVLGAPDVQLGHAVKIDKLPTADWNGTFRVVGVRHRLSKPRGFLTDIDWEEPGK